MAITEVDYTWSFTAGSTGTGARIDGRSVREWAFHVECPSGSTAVVEIQAFRDLNSTSIGAVQGSSQAVSSSLGASVVLGLTGPYAAIAPRVVSLTATTGVVTIRAVGN